MLQNSSSRNISAVETTSSNVDADQEVNRSPTIKPLDDWKVTIDGENVSLPNSDSGKMFFRVI